MGAIALLCQLIAGTGWTRQPKEKIAAGRLKGRLEDHLLTEPDPCILAPTHPEFRAQNRAAVKASLEWRKKVATLDLSSLEKQAATACAKFAANQEGGADEYAAELFEKFGITE